MMLPVEVSDGKGGLFGNGMAGRQTRVMGPPPSPLHSGCSLGDTFDEATAWISSDREWGVQSWFVDGMFYKASDEEGEDDLEIEL